MSVERTQSPVTSPRCPWCHEGTDPSGEGWVTCPHDRTPAHKECVREFGVCPICREPLDSETAAAPPAFPERLSRRAMEQGVFVRPRTGGKRFGIEALPGEVELQLAAIARDYRKRPVRWLAAGGWTLALLIEIAFVAFYIAAESPIALLFAAAALGSLFQITVALALRGPLVAAAPRVGFFRGSSLGGRRAWALVETIVKTDQELLLFLRRHRLVVAVAEAAELDLAALETAPHSPDTRRDREAAAARGADASRRAETLRETLLEIARENGGARAARDALLPRGKRASAPGARGGNVE